jgi:hypothetical protein
LRFLPCFGAEGTKYTLEVQPKKALRLPNTTFPNISFSLRKPGLVKLTDFCRREDYEFLDLPTHLPKLCIVLKRLETIVAHHGFLSSSSIHHVSGHGEEMIVGTVDIPVGQLERGKNNEAWWPIQDDQEEKIGEVFLKIRHDELVVLLAKDYEPISLLLHGFSNGLTEEIAQVMPTGLRALSEILMNIFQVSGHAGDWLMTLVEDEIDGVGKDTPVSRLRWSRRIGSNESFNSVSDREQTVRDIGKSLQGEANLLFRGNSLFTQAMDFHMRRLGKEYLEDVLSEKVSEINGLNPDCEVDPSRLSHSDDGSKNWTLLITLTTDVWESIASSVSRCPGELRQIFKYIRAVAEDRYGDFLRTVPYTSVSGFLFLRFLCPALLNPKLFGLLRDHPQPKAQRTLTLIAKSLQALANLSSFGQKESWMEPMNRFLCSHRQSVKDFIDAICSIPAERNTFALPASYSTPITILARLPQTSREGFPSLPYLIDHARNFASLVKLWLDGTSRYILPHTLSGDLAEFNALCLSLQRRTDECLLKVEGERPGGVEQLSLQWEVEVEDMAEGLESTSISNSGYEYGHGNSNITSFYSNATPELGSLASPQTLGWNEGTTGGSGSEREREKDRRERGSFWESMVGKERGGQRGYDGGSSTQEEKGGERNGNGKVKSGFLSGLRRKKTDGNGSAIGSVAGSVEKDIGMGMTWPAGSGAGGGLI